MNHTFVSRRADQLCRQLSPTVVPGASSPGLCSCLGAGGSRNAAPMGMDPGASLSRKETLAARVDSALGLSCSTDR